MAGAGPGWPKMASRRSQDAQDAPKTDFGLILVDFFCDCFKILGGLFVPAWLQLGPNFAQAKLFRIGINFGSLA